MTSRSGDLLARDRLEVDQTLKRLTRRFLTAAILKYAALELRRGGALYWVDVGRFHDRTQSIKSIRTALQVGIVRDPGWTGMCFAIR